MTPRILFLSILFTAFLFPISVEGDSVNYAFLLLPVGVALAQGKCKRPGKLLLGFMAFYVFIYLVAALYQYELYSEVLRRTTSFLIFMSMFSYAFIEIDADMIAAFKVSLIAISVLFSLTEVVTFITVGAASMGVEDAKNEVGSQRMGFLYLLALSILHLYPVRGFVPRMAKILGYVVLFVGLILTFSRASIVGVLVVAGSYLLWSLRHVLRRPERLLTRVLPVVAGVVVAFLLIAQFVPIVADFFNERLVGFLTNPEAVEGTLSTSATSEGERIFIWTQILDYIASNPLTGSGYVGVWRLKLFEGMSGSAHSQYADVLFRTGFAGFLIYLYLIYRIVVYLYRYQPGLLWGFLGVLVYGFFHETFKDSQGEFLLAFLLGMMSQTAPSLAKGSSGLPQPAKPPRPLLEHDAPGNSLSA